MRSWLIVAIVPIACDDREESMAPDGGSCCSQCGPEDPVCVHCPGHFEECIERPWVERCRHTEGLELCECLTTEGQGTCEVVDGAVRLTYNATFCAHAVDYVPPERLNACTYDPASLR